MNAGRLSRLKPRRIARYCSITAATTILSIAQISQLALAGTAADKQATFNIPAQPLLEALLQLGEQAHVQIILPNDVADGRTSKEIKGTLRLSDALKALLSGSGLSFQETPENTIIVAPVTTRAPGTDKPYRLAGLPTEGGNANTGPEPPIEDYSGVEPYAERKKGSSLEIVEVTGSRILAPNSEHAQAVKIYTQEQIQASGQNTLATFFNTLPEVSVNSLESAKSSYGGATSVQLHGLPVGTTLVLINGRRVVPSALQAAASFDFFDLDNIPLAAIDRIEVVPEGSSAIYGSDAIAGVVNIILKQDFDGLSLDGRAGWASGVNQSDASASWGKRWDRGAFSVVGTFQKHGSLDGSERAETSNSEIFPICPLANIYSTSRGNLPGTNAAYAAVTANSTSQHFAATPGSLNQCSLTAPENILASTQRWGTLVQGHYDVSPAFSVFTEILYSHLKENYSFGPPELFGEVGYQQFTASADNPFNPYGQTVGISQALRGETNNAYDTTTNFLRPLVGVRGEMTGSWDWEVAGWLVDDRTNFSQPGSFNLGATQSALDSPNPATALNPFIAGPAGSPQLMQSIMETYVDQYDSKTSAVNGFVRGPAVILPSGPLQVVLGTEYDRDTQVSKNVSDLFAVAGQSTYSRRSYSVFGESRVPILGGEKDSDSRPSLVASLAGRYDNYSDFGGKTTPQFGLEWRPWDSLLLRGSYGRAFKAPPLFAAYAPQATSHAVVSDPLLGGRNEAIQASRGGNINLLPETGVSKAIGLLYAGDSIPGLNISITHWDITESNSIQRITPQAIVNNESLFPQDVVRASSCTDGPPCPISFVQDTYLNFGEISVRGIDYHIGYKFLSHVGELSPTINATQTYRYDVALVPGAPMVEAAGVAQDSLNWAPRWKGTAALNWKMGLVVASIDGRYVGRYRDYDSSNSIGNFWLCDLSARWSVGKSLAPADRWLAGAYVQVGATNLFNSLAQRSNYHRNDLGYDPVQGDILGRVVYLQAGVML